MTRKHTAILLASLMMATSAAASAEAPTSQFGFTGWPYRQSTVCQTKEPAATTAPQPTDAPSMAPTEEPTTAPTVIPTQCPDNDTIMDENGQNCPMIPTKEPVAATEQPTAAPSATPVPTEAVRPTVKPTAKPTATPVATKTPSMDEDYNTNSVSVQEQIAYNFLNNDRNANGLPSLTLDPALSELARIKSNDMRDNRYFAHESPTYGNASNMLKLFGYSFNAVGENIAHHATVEKAQAAFMSSDGHRRNILSASWTKVGIGVSIDAQGYVYVTQLFVR